MLDKAELNRRRAQSRRDKARNRREEEEEEKAEAKRRRAQSQRDKARNRREEEERISRITGAVQRQLALDCQQKLPPAVPEEPSSTVSLVAIMEARSSKVMRDIARMFEDARYSDATVVIHGRELPVHRSVICTQSEYFEKAFKEAFAEGSSGVLTFNHDSAAAHWRVFEYLYTGDYSDDLSHRFEDDPSLLKEPRVYALADMFFLEDLKALATVKLQQKLQDLWTSDSFPGCIREIYATTRENGCAMRSAVVEVATKHVSELGQKIVFKDLIREGGDFTVDYLTSVVFPEPRTVSSSRPQPNGLFGGTLSGTNRTYSTWG
ncbi:hypothetical protein HBI23_255110 [Parastagonospora nodorum]|nr:hypothetical protein HBI23_255110 [Parastagonospora nodorum]KAH5621131.1 hypothetical protein HBI51_250410 [Parastagonospora nodorum]KAH5983245.1 hypothetical protein HBI84_248790 [Parastagonospora nodorum]KAH6133479.1 hypothetical protein HBI68_253900 [Parastagonospora nodorum]KAH6383590.1 hypothetical protein HBI60_256660 [Parastagonospora nodorum]